MLTRRSRVMLAFALLAAGSGVLLADDAHKPTAPTPDDELLEFLGSVDPASDAVQPDDGTWIQYLSQTDISKVAAKPDKPTVVAAKPAAPATPPAKPSTPGAKQND